MAEIMTDGASPNTGRIQIADDVIAVIAGTAALEVDGVITPGNLSGKVGVKNLAKGVKISVEGNDASIDISVAVKLGCKIQDVSAEMQRRVATAVETMTGLHAAGVSVNITGINAEKDGSGKE